MNAFAICSPTADSGKHISYIIVYYSNKPLFEEESILSWLQHPRVYLEFELRPSTFTVKIPQDTKQLGL